MITRFRTHAHAAGLGLYYSMAFPASLMVIGWALYLPGWLDADRFVFLLRWSFYGALAAIGSVLVTWTFVALGHDGESRS